MPFILSPLAHYILTPLGGSGFGAGGPFFVDGFFTDGFM